MYKGLEILVVYCYSKRHLNKSTGPFCLDIPFHAQICRCHRKLFLANHNTRLTVMANEDGNDRPIIAGMLNS